jgi:hypothetical protein
VTVKLGINGIPGHRFFHDVIIVGNLRSRDGMLEETIAIKTGEVSVNDERWRMGITAYARTFSNASRSNASWGKSAVSSTF